MRSVSIFLAKPNIKYTHTHIHCFLLLAIFIEHIANKVQTTKTNRHKKLVNNPKSYNMKVRASY